MSNSDECIVINGRACAQRILDSVKKRAQEFASIHKILPALAVIMVGDNPASKIYVELKKRRALENGIESLVYHFPEATNQDDVLKVIRELNQNTSVHGILVQLPLPKTLSAHAVLNEVDWRKDVDCFTPYNVGLFNLQQPNVIPCTPQGIMILIKENLGPDLTGKKAVVIGRSIIVGQPTASLLLNEGCSVSVLHSKSQNPDVESSTADILIVATGVAHLVGKDWVKKGACVIDVGITNVGGVLVGDVNFEEVKKYAGFITPVPGGVGPMTIACLLKNTVELAYKIHQ